MFISLSFHSHRLAFTNLPLVYHPGERTKPAVKPNTNPVIIVRQVLGLLGETTTCSIRYLSPRLPSFCLHSRYPTSRICRIRLIIKYWPSVHFTYAHFCRINGLRISCAIGDISAFSSPLCSYRNNTCSIIAVLYISGSDANPDVYVTDMRPYGVCNWLKL